MRIELTSPAWKADALPLSYTRRTESSSRRRHIKVEGVGFEPTCAHARQIYSLLPLATRPSLQAYTIKRNNHTTITNPTIKTATKRVYTLIATK